MLLCGFIIGLLIVRRKVTLLFLPSASWLSSNDLSELESAVLELLRHLVEKSSAGQFNQLLLMIREGLDVSKLRAGNYRVRTSSLLLVFIYDILLYLSKISLFCSAGGAVCCDHY